MPEINKNINEIPFYLTKKISEEIGDDPNIINLSRGQAGFKPPLRVYEEAKKLINPEDKTFFKYEKSAGSKNLRESIARFYKKQFNLDITSDSVIVTDGGTGGIGMALQFLTNPGDEIIIPDPSYPFYILAAKHGLENRIVKRVSIGNNKVTMEKLEPIITTKTRLLILTSPHNPTGVVYDEKTLKGIMELAKEKNFFVLYDENHFPEVHDGGKHLPIQLFDKNQENSISIGSISRLGLQGERIGWVILSKNFSEKFSAAYSTRNLSVNTPAQKLTSFVLDNYNELDFDKEFKEYEKKRNQFIPEINKLDGFECHMPEGTAYAFPNIKNFVEKYKEKLKEIVRNEAMKRGRSKEDIDFALAHNSVLVYKFLLYKVGVGVIPGISYGPNSDDYIRLSFSVKKEEVVEALNRMKDMYKFL